MTIVKHSSSRTSNIPKRKKLIKGSGSSDVFSDSHLRNSFEFDKTEAAEEVQLDVEAYKNDDEEEEYSQAPKEDLQDLFIAIQKRLKKKTVHQKRVMEGELKKTINRTIVEMNQKIEVAKNHIDLKLFEMKSELENIQRDREGQLKSIKSEYEQFKNLIQKAIDKIDLGEGRINGIRDRFLNEIISFNRDFEFPKDKVEELFDSTLKEVKNKSERRFKPNK